MHHPRTRDERRALRDRYDTKPFRTRNGRTLPNGGGKRNPTGS